MSYAWVKKENPSQTPKWCSVDFTNNPLIARLGISGKKRLFRLLLSFGLQEIELGRPGVNEADFELVRSLIEEDLIPANRNIRLRTGQSAQEIEKLFAAIKSLKARKLSFTICLTHDGGTQEASARQAQILTAVSLIRQLSTEAGLSVTLAYMPPQDRDVSELVSLCGKVLQQWGKSERASIISIEAGAGNTWPHLFANYLEQIAVASSNNHCQISVRFESCTQDALLTAELAVFAGATHIEAGVFRCEERDTSALIPALAQKLEDCGTKAGLKLPKYPRLISELLNLTQGKRRKDDDASASDILRAHYRISLPPGLRAEFNRQVNLAAEQGGGDPAPEEIYGVFQDNYLLPNATFALKDVTFIRQGALTLATLTIEKDGRQYVKEAAGNGILDAASNCYMNDLGISYRLEHFEEHSLGGGSSAKACSFVGVVDGEKVFWGAGIHEDISRSSIMALTIAVGRLLQGKDKARGENERIHKILEYVRQHYKDVTLEELSGAFYLSGPYLSKYIRQKSGRTFGENLKQIRMQKASLLLKNSNMKIESVANAAGYPNVEHFNRLFKKEFGCTPVQYRTDS